MADAIWVAEYMQIAPGHPGLDFSSVAHSSHAATSSVELSRGDAVIEPASARSRRREILLSCCPDTPLRIWRRVLRVAV